MPTNSAPIRINRKVELRKASTRNKTELTGFFEKITKMHVVIKNAANKKKRAN
jgi:predicted HAD superfamily Cof-like phosphohydrolase